MSRATISLRGAVFTIALPSSVRSPELTIVDLTGRMVYHTMLSVASRKMSAEGGAAYDCAWRGARATGAYIAVLRETSQDGKALSARTKFVVGK